MTLFCNSDFATVTSSAWTCHSNEQVLSLDVEEQTYFDDEVMMDWMRGSDSRVPSHCLMDQAMEGRCSGIAGCDFQADSDWRGMRGFLIGVMGMKTRVDYYDARIHSYGF